ncbi:MAG: SIS domain-containing protein [Candidatus Krumholzibacteriia bacterium]
MSGARDLFQHALADHRQAVDRLGDLQSDALDRLAGAVLATWRQGGKLLVCGNGGSAADSQHLAAELAGRYRRERPGWAALALTTDTSALTAISNDFGFDQVFARQVEALGRPGDVLLVISTSGNSANCVEAVGRGRALGLTCHGLLGGDGGRLLASLDGAIVVPASDTPRIQELHLLCIHVLCELLEAGRPEVTGD